MYTNYVSHSCCSSDMCRFIVICFAEAFVVSIKLLQNSSYTPKPVWFMFGAAGFHFTMFSPREGKGRLACHPRCNSCGEPSRGKHENASFLACSYHGGRVAINGHIVERNRSLVYTSACIFIYRFWYAELPSVSMHIQNCCVGLLPGPFDKCKNT